MKAVLSRIILLFYLTDFSVAVLQLCQQCDHPCESTADIECMDGMCYTNTTGGETFRGCSTVADCETYSPDTVTCCNKDNCNAILTPSTVVAEPTTSQAPVSTTEASAGNQGDTESTEAPAPAPTTTTTTAAPPTTKASTKAPSTTSAAPAPTTTGASNNTPKVKCYVCSSTSSEKCGLSDMVATAAGVAEESCSGQCSLLTTREITGNTTVTSVSRSCMTSCEDEFQSATSGDVKTETTRSCCKEDSCNGVVAGVKETPIQCHSCEGNDDTTCAKNLTAVQSAPCYTKCYTKSTVSSSGTKHYERGCSDTCTTSGDNNNFTKCCSTEKCNTDMAEGVVGLKCYKCTGGANCPENTEEWNALDSAAKTDMEESCDGKCYKSVTPIVKIISRGCMPTCTNAEVGGAKFKCCDTNLCNKACNLSSLASITMLLTTIIAVLVNNTP